MKSPGKISLPEGKIFRRLIPAVTVCAVLVMFSAAVISGCAGRTGEPPLPADKPESFSPSGDRRVPDRWWTAFGDEKLDSLVEQALEKNLDLKTAWHRLTEACRRLELSRDQAGANRKMLSLVKARFANGPKARGCGKKMRGKARSPTAGRKIPEAGKKKKVGLKDDFRAGFFRKKQRQGRPHSLDGQKPHCRKPSDGDSPCWGYLDRFIHPEGGFSGIRAGPCGCWQSS